MRAALPVPARVPAPVPRKRGAAAPPRQRRKDARPAELIDAALTVFVEKGFAATRIDEIAALAGVSKGTLYLYYPSKESLLEAVIRHHLSLPITSSAEAFAGYRGPIAALLRSALVPAWLAIVEGPASGVIKLIVTEVRNFPDIAVFYAREVIEPAHRVIGAAIERGIARREFRRVDVADTVRSIVLPLVTLCVYRHSLAASVPACMPVMTNGGMRGFIDHHLDLVLRGLAREPIAGSTKPATHASTIARTTALAAAATIAPKRTRRTASGTRS